MDTSTTVDSQHPRVHIDSAEDLLFVKQQLLRASEQLVEQNAPKTDSPETDKEIRSLLKLKMVDLIDSILELSYPNIEINGLSCEEALNANKTYEQLDESLKMKLESKINLRDDLLVKVVSLRKQIPTQIAQIVSNDQRNRSIHSIQVNLPAENNEEDEEEKLDENSEPVDFNLLADTYKETLEIPELLRKKIPILKNKLERAKLSYTL